MNFENHDLTRETPAAADTTNEFQLTGWARRIAIAFIIAALVGLIVCIGLLIQSYITQKPAFELADLRFAKPGFERLQYNGIVFYIAGFLTLLIALNTHLLIGTRLKKISYISALIGTFLLLFSFGLLFISQEPSLEWWGYLSKVTSGIGYISLIFSTMVSKERKKLRGILTFVFFVFMIAGAMLSVVSSTSSSQP